MRVLGSMRGIVSLELMRSRTLIQQVSRSLRRLWRKLLLLLRLLRRRKLWKGSLREVEPCMIRKWSDKPMLCYYWSSMISCIDQGQSVCICSFGELSSVDNGGAVKRSEMLEILSWCTHFWPAYIVVLYQPITLIYRKSKISIKNVLLKWWLLFCTLS